MIIPEYEIKTAVHAMGKGIFLKAPVVKGQILLAPDKIDRVYNAEERAALIPGSPEDEAVVRWFESYHTICLDWPDDCYLNHSFNPNCLWHMGFVFALRVMAPGEEITVDYRFVVDDNEVMPFKDSETGEAIIGYPWKENLKKSTEALLALLNETA